MTARKKGSSLHMRTGKKKTASHGKAVRETRRGRGMRTTPKVIKDFTAGWPPLNVMKMIDRPHNGRPQVSPRKTMR